MIYIWGKPACPYCDMAKTLCEQRNYTFEYRQLGVDFDRDEILAEFPEARTFPQIVVIGLIVVGYDLFIIYFEDSFYTVTVYTL